VERGEGGASTGRCPHSGGSEAHGGRVCQHAEAIDVSLLADFWRCRRPPVAAVIIEAPSMFQARMTAVVRRLAPGVPFGEVSSSPPK
jgi:hypothetical protein